MPDKGGPTQDSDRPGRERNPFTLVGQVAHWDPTARELRIGGRVLRVAASVLFVGNVAAGIPITASGYQSTDPSTPWVVTQLRVG